MVKYNILKHYLKFWFSEEITEELFIELINTEKFNNKVYTFMKSESNKENYKITYKAYLNKITEKMKLIKIYFADKYNYYILIYEEE